MASTLDMAGRRMRGHFKRLVTAPQFGAVLDCVFELHPKRTSLVFAELCVLDGQLVFARADGDDAFRHFVGSRDQLAINLLGFVTHLGLGAEDRAYVERRLSEIPARSSR